MAVVTWTLLTKVYDVRESGRVTGDIAHARNAGEVQLWGRGRAATSNVTTTRQHLDVLDTLENDKPQKSEAPPACLFGSHKDAPHCQAKAAL